MKKYFLVIITLSILLAGCAGKGIESHLKNRYINYKLFYGEKLTSHFPKNYSIESTMATNIHNRNIRLRKYNFSGMSMNYRIVYNKMEYQQIKKKFKSISKASYLSTDTSYIVVFNFCNKAIIDGELHDGLASSHELRLAKHNINSNSDFPIPNFNLSYSSTFCGLNSSYEISVIDAKPGKYLEDKYLYDSSECLPEKWRHGISRGVACSDKDRAIIYWIVVW